MGWLDESFHASFRDAFARIAAERQIGCLACCLMPDHMHLLLCGLSDESDQTLFVRALRRELGKILVPISWQKQPFDNVLREKDRSEDALLTVARYIIENPVRAGLVKVATDWAYAGAWLPDSGWMDSCAVDFGVKFWAEYNLLVERV